jgi:hypothetical protein
VGNVTSESIAAMAKSCLPMGFIFIYFPFSDLLIVFGPEPALTGTEHHHPPTMRDTVHG